MISESDLASWLPFPDKDANKYTRGTCVVVGGCAAYPGAVCLAACASQFSGAGYTHVFTDPANEMMVRLFRPSLVVSSFSDFAPEGALKHGHKGAYLVGTGFDAADNWSVDLLQQILGATHTQMPLLVDGGGLSTLATLVGDVSVAEVISYQGSLVLTPHAGEAERLARAVDLDAAGLPQEDLAGALAQAYQATVVLKGPDTVVADLDRCERLTQGTAALAKAGTGDVLAGLIAGLLTQGMDPFKASALGVSLHAYAGRIAAEKAGPISVCAEEVLAAVPDAIRWLESKACKDAAQ